MWEVNTSDLFDKWFDSQTEELQEDILAGLGLIEAGGPNLGRPFVDTVRDSIFKNMKELRIQHKGDPIRAFFAFDPERNAIALCAGDKSGVNEAKFYADMIKLADREYQKHLDSLEK